MEDKIIEEGQVEVGEAEIITFDEILQDKIYQSEFDKRVSKAIETAKTNWQVQLEREKNEAEKLAKMKEDERVSYEKEKIEKELNTLKQQLNAKDLKDEAIKIASEKELPISYLDLIDFTKESAESINAKLQSIAEARSKDLEGYLNSKLKEKAPYQKAEEKSATIDPFVKGFEKGWTNK